MKNVKNPRNSSKETSWNYLEFRVEEEIDEDFLYLLQEFGLHCYTVIENNHTHLYVYHPEGKSLPEEVEPILKKFKRIKSGRDYQSRWLLSYKKYFKPIYIENFVVVPPWMDVEEGGKIVINPGMSFGTGNHESTKIALSLLIDTFDGECSLLDVGTGSGIIAIVAKKLGFERVLGIDIDPQAVKEATENARLNGVQVDFLKIDGKNWHFGFFDTSVANIDCDTILEIRKELIESTNKKLIISGIYKGEVGKIIEGFKSSFKPITIKKMGDWHGVAFKRVIG